MDAAAVDLHRHLADRGRTLRAAHGLSLESLSSKSGVSRSMISGLGVTLASLFDRSASSPGAASSPLSRRDDQPEWQDPASGYIRRNVSPSGVSQPMQIVEVHFPSGARVAFENGARQTAESTARDRGKTLLVLDAVTDCDRARLYQRLGWVRVGDIPGYALMPHGGLCSTTVFCRNV
jgi:hypothetical protein